MRTPAVPDIEGSFRARARPTIVEGLYSFRIGGSEKLGALLARQFAARGYRVLALSFFDHDGPVRAELEAAGVECHGLGVESRLPWQRIGLGREIRDFLRRQRTDVLHLHHGVTLIRAAGPARAAGVGRVVVTEHSPLQLRNEPRYRRMTRDALRDVDAATVINRELEDYFRTELALDPARLHLVPNAVDPAYAALATARRARPASAGPFTFAFVGRLVPEKGLDTLLGALKLVRDAGVNARLVVAGDGPERERLVHCVRVLGLEGRVEWLGAQPDGRAALRDADAFAMSSVSEGVPMALLEAMSAGLPCVATDVGGIAAVLANGRGLVVPPGRPAELAAALKRVATEPALARGLAEAARGAMLRDYSIDAVVDAYLGVFGLPVAWGSRAA